MTVRMSLSALRLERATHVEAQGSQIVAISGFGGAGKSTLAAALAAEFEPAAVVSADDFILGQLGERGPDWQSIDRRRLVRTVLEPARRGSPIRYQQYDWANDRLGEQRRSPPRRSFWLRGWASFIPAFSRFSTSRCGSTVRSILRLSVAAIAPERSTVRITMGYGEMSGCPMTGTTSTNSGLTCSPTSSMKPHCQIGARPMRPLRKREAECL